MLSMESETTVHKRRRGSFRHDENKHGSSTRLSSLAQEPQTRSDGKHLRRESLSEALVRLGREIEEVANGTSVGNARTPRVILGILPCVRITKPNRAANSVKGVLLCTERLTVSHRKRMVEKVLLLHRRFPGNQVACARTLSRRNPI